MPIQSNDSLSNQVRVFPVVYNRRLPAVHRPDGTRCGSIKPVMYGDWFGADRGGQGHKAQDIFAAEGSLVVAPVAGRITSVRDDTAGHGGYNLKLKGQNGLTYYMAHLLYLPIVRVGQTVEPGTHLGQVGRTGNATHLCPHLHLGCKNASGTPVNLYAALVAANPTIRGAK